MTRILTVLAFCAAPFMAAAQEPVPSNPEIEAIIDGQMQAFRSGDADAAWDYASPIIQGIFDSPDRFAQMVENGYPMVWNPGEVSYLGLRQQGRWFYQRVQVIDRAGAAHYLEYQMVLQDGLWLINGVALLPAPGVGA